MHCLTVTLFFFCLLALASSALKASHSFDVDVPSFNVNSSDVMAVCIFIVMIWWWWCLSYTEQSSWLEWSDLYRQRFGIRNQLCSGAVSRQHGWIGQIPAECCKYNQLNRIAIWCVVMRWFKATRKGGYWLAQANVIARVKQGSDWQSLTNGQLFTNRDQFGCFYHDNVIFAYIVKILWISRSLLTIYFILFIMTINQFHITHPRMMEMIKRIA